MDGVKFGVFNVMLYYLNEKGEKRWTNATVLDRADIAVNGDLLVLTAKVHKGVEAVDQKFDAISNKPFEFTYQITMQPNTDWFISEIIELKNLDEKDNLEILGVFLRLYPDYKAMELAPVPYKVPNLWKVDDNVSVWKEKDGDRYMGVTALRYQDIKRSYWITPEDGGFHADAWREIIQKLKPAEAIRFDNPLYLINYLGRGDMEAMKTLKKVLPWWNSISASTKSLCITSKCANILVERTLSQVQAFRLKTVRFSIRMAVKRLRSCKCRRKNGSISR